MRFDKWTYVIGAAAVAVAVILGALTGAWQGAVAAVGGLGSAALWEAAAARREKDRARREVLEHAERQLAPPHEQIIPAGDQVSGQDDAPWGYARYLYPEAAVVSFWPRPVTRVLLLARSAGEWWEQLITASRKPVSGSLAAVPPIGLRALSGPERQQDVFQHAVAAFAARLGTGCPAGARLPAVGPDAVVLFIHAAALLAVLDYGGAGDPGSAIRGPDEVIAGLLGHEARYWQQSQHQYGLATAPRSPAASSPLPCSPASPP